VAVNIGPVITAVAVHRKASSACCAAPLNLAAPDAAHGLAHECQGCGQGTELVLGEPRYIPASSLPGGLHPVKDGA
jgi:hypothetical protein